MDEIADYTTPRFRNNRPKSVWVVDTWKALRRLKYERINSNITDSRALGNKAVVAVEAKINTAAGEITQKEIYTILLRKGKIG